MLLKLRRRRRRSGVQLKHKLWGGETRKLLMDIAAAMTIYTTRWQRDTAFGSFPETFQLVVL
jgi:hypothetical protein